MSDFENILRTIRSLLLEEGVRYKKASTTSAGNSDGSTMVSTTLVELDDEYNNMVCRLLSGTYSGQKRTVEDFTASSDTLDFSNNVWPAQIAVSTEFELYEPGIWDGDDLKRIIEHAANQALRNASEDLLVNYALREEIASISGVVDLPANALRFLHPILRVKRSGDTEEKVCDILDPKDAYWLDNDPFINPTTGDPIGFFIPRADSTKNVGRFKFKPSINATCIWNVVKVASFDSDGNWKVPEELWDQIIDSSVKFALAANERIDLSQFWESQEVRFIPTQKETESAA